MAREIFEVTKDRFHLQDPCCYILQGTWPKEAKMRAKLDGSEVKAEIQRLEVVSALDAGRADHSGCTASGISGGIPET